MEIYDYNMKRKDKLRESKSIDRDTRKDRPKLENTKTNLDVRNKRVLSPQPRNENRNKTSIFFPKGYKGKNMGYNKINTQHNDSFYTWDKENKSDKFEAIRSIHTSNLPQFKVDVNKRRHGNF